jgi:hypothetical protein
VNGEDRRFQMRKCPDSFLDGVGNVVELQVEEDWQFAFGNVKHALFTVGAEEFQAKLHAASNTANVAGDRCGAVNVGRVDRNEDRVQITGSPSCTCG